MINRKKKRWTGFQGEKRISLPSKVLGNMTDESLYLNHIGFYPKAHNHYRRRKNGCGDNILIYCLQGKGYYALDGCKQQVNANQFVIIPSTSKPLSYWADLDDPWTIYWIHFTGNNLSEFNNKFQIEINNYPAYIQYNTEGIQLWNKMYDSLSQGFSTPNLLNASMCLYHFIATFIYPQHHNIKYTVDKDRDVINQTIDYMKNHLNKKMNICELALLHNLSESYFSKLFRTGTGMPPMDYFIYIKMQEACKLLCTTKLRIKQIANTMGYEDPYYFSRIFKKNMNMSPENYRKAILTEID